MSDKKHIDKLFQQKLKDFEATPSPAVWDRISTEMGQPGKKRRLIPLWLRISGIAAGIVILIALGNSFFNQDDAENNIPTPVVETQNEVDNSDQNGLDLKVQDGLSETPVSKEDAQQFVEESGQDEDAGIEKNNSISSQKTVLKKPDTKLAETPDSEQQNFKNTSNKQLLNNEKRSTVDGNSKSSETNPVASAEKDNSNPSEKLKNQNPNLIKDKTELKELINVEEKDANSKVAENKTGANEQESIPSEENKTDQIKEEEKESIMDAIAENDNEEEKEQEEDPAAKRWSVSPNIAPVYYNSFGAGSSIDDKFKGNSRTGEINLSYGVGASYAFNDNLKIRAGINRMNLSYRTNDIVVYNNVEPDAGTKPLKNVDLNESHRDLSFLSANGLIFAQVPGVVANSIESSIDQELGFLEIPVELEYTISNKQLDINLIGGFSTLILNENNIYSTLQGERTLLGEASNINTTSFSANVGIGFNYEVSEKIDLNLEPMLKYQLNTFSNTSGNFNPYTIGIHTGFRFKF